MIDDVDDDDDDDEDDDEDEGDDEDDDEDQHWTLEDDRISTVQERGGAVLASNWMNDKYRINLINDEH